MYGLALLQVGTGIADYTDVNTPEIGILLSVETPLHQKNNVITFIYLFL
jgi:hypothetical protein